MTFAFTVRGLPQPKGSSRAFVVKGRAVVTSDNPKAREWAKTVRFCLQDWTRGLLPAAVPVKLTLDFALPRPASVSARRRPAPTVKPDVDKLARTVLDALTGIVVADDAQIVELAVVKRYGQEPGLQGLIEWEVDDAR